MKRFFLFLLLTPLILFSQERISLKTRYKIPSKIIFKSLKKRDKRDTVPNPEMGRRTNIKIEKNKNFVGVLDYNGTKDGSVKMKDDKVYINFYLQEDESSIHRDYTYYFQLKNRQTIKLRHNDISLSALTIPIKYRFDGRNNDTDISFDEEFSAGFNANLFLSFAFSGKTKFTYLKNLDNSVRDISWRWGIFTGLGAHTLNTNNTSAAGENRRFSENREESKGLFSFGTGVTYSYRTFSIGAFYGYDYSVGKGAGVWDYDGKPWIGISLGIELLKFPSFGDQ